MTEQPQAEPQTQSQQQTPPPPYAASYRRLTRTSWDSPISGVCGGIAKYAGLDPTLVRVLAVIAAFVTFPVGVIVYFVMWGVVPRE